ncbi:dihydroxyacetone kinase [Suhomyces tanzawaensis NRRL Y-17324]|uniref:Dihydroxyacetone kinase n=1 Tax=Suhomyces tanzawaensis NRRL Y-17324 TaxID=984487 RepID=A0A1E4SBH1_9ASCO|nr:dihydroxyacetone kinase [Suhomyces tanzawaensis NRRL Y-17324]ODV76864.1 dihydroxyacetone kinase [Suhomyces tanzawaensis NRRL Y-17324]
MTLAKHWKYNDDVVVAQLKGLTRSNPSISLIPSEKVVFNPHSDTSKKVTLISGGGAGHEPLHGGFVGENLLDAAVSGAVFASPSTKQIMAAIKTKSNKEKGTLMIVKNYTGDVLHFGLVAERAKSEGYAVEIMFVGDDVAVGREQNKMVGRRGLAGTAIVHKVVGAAVNSKVNDLKSVADLGRAINDSLVTIGASLDRTSVPGKAGEVEFNKDDEAELGLGIHNEPGHKLTPIPDIDDLLKDMFQKLVSPDDSERHYVDFDLKNDEYVLLVNNIGGTSSLELYAIAEHVVKNLPFSKKPKRVLVSDFVTSLNAPGFSITLLNLSKIDKTDLKYTSSDVLEFLDAETNAPGWKPKTFSSEQWETEPEFVDSPMEDKTIVTSSLEMDASHFQESLTRGLKNLIEAEPKITHYDTLVGDGDCGETLKDGAEAILEAFEKKKFTNLNDPVATLAEITELVEDSMGGTSGGIYSIYLTALVQNIQKSKDVSVKSLAEAFYKALYDGLFKYTKARIGGRTLVDTLQPFVDSLHKTGDIQEAAAAAKKGCDHTKGLVASFGRASYVDEEEFSKEGGIPDPGAVGLLALIEGFVGK